MTPGAPDESDETAARPAVPESDPTVRFTPGTVLAGRYRIVSPLGKGGMGEVYRADDIRLGQSVALKFLPAALATDQDRLDRLVDEVRIGRQISHPNVCRLYDIAEAEGHHFLVMEYVDGEDLASLLRRIGRLPGDKALDLARGMCAGLAAAHDKGVIHRDLKPANVMIDAQGHARIADFGLAALAKGSGVADMSGTPQYMAPEQLLGEGASLRSDVYALGLVFREMLTGQRVFKGKSLDELRALHAAKEQPPLPSTAPDVASSFERVILACLARDPKDRPASARELGAALESLASELSDASTRAASVEIAAPTEVSSRWSSRPALVVAGAVLALALAIVSWVGFRTSRGTIDSLAVLPFENASQNPDVEYLADGLTDSLINQMSRVPSLTVRARANVFRFKGTDDPQEAGRKLGVGAVLTGSVSLRGDQLSISAELMEIATGARLWGERYDRPKADLLRVQDAIAADISDGLRLRLSGQERRTLGGHGTLDPEAYELSLKAGFFLVKDTEEGVFEARQLFLRAAQKDPNFVDAHLGIAVTYGMSAVSGYERPAEAWAQVTEEAQKVLKLDPGNVLARCALANRRFFFEWDWAVSEREFQELSNDPRVLRGQQFRPILLSLWARGRTEDAVVLMEKALRVDPGDPSLKNMMGNYLANAGRFEEAIASYRAALKADPSDSRPLFGLAEVLRRRGDIRGAIESRRSGYQLGGEEDGAKALAGAQTEKDYEAAEVAVARSRLVEQEALAKEQYVSPLDLARLYAQVGDGKKAFASLEAALAERSAGLVLLKVERAWDGIRADARFAAVVRTVGIP